MDSLIPHELIQVEVVTSKMEDNKAEYESKLEEYAQLLDIRAARIRVHINFKSCHEKIIGS